MRPLFSRFVFLFLLFVGYNSIAQTNADKDAFAEAFIKIFQQRANGFDSIANFKASTADGFDAKIKFPGAGKSLIKDNKYLAEYTFKDSLSAVSFFSSLKIWLNYAASAYNSKALFILLYDDPQQLKFFLSDSSGFIHAENYLSLFKTKNAKPFAIELEIDSERAMSYYTNYGDKIINPVINTLISEVSFGTDVQMAKIKKNKKQATEGFTYESTRTLPGYTASIYEYIEESEGTENKLQLIKKWTGQQKTVNQKVDSMILMLKTALPSSYCYHIDGEKQAVSFYQHPFSNEKQDAEFTIAYGLNEGEKDSYYIALIISRIQLNEPEVEKEEIKLYPFKDVNGKYGYRDKDKKVIVPGKYDKAADFREERGHVVLNKKEGFIDITGREVIPVKYDYTFLYFFNGLAKVELNDKYGMIDINGKEVVPVKYDDLDMDDLYYSDEENAGQAYEFIMVKLQGKYGFVDKSNREIVPIKYDYAKIIGPGKARVSLNKKEGVIDSKGKEIAPVRYEAMNTDGYKEYGTIKVRLNEKWGLLDNAGKLIIPLKYDYTANGFFEGLAWVNLDDKYGFVDKAGKEVIALKYFSVDDFSEGLAAARLNGKYGFINKTGKEAITLNYEDCESFSQGLAAAKLNGKWGYIDKANKTIVPFKYDRAKAFDKSGQAKVYIGKKWGKINLKGVIVKPIENEDSDDDDEW